VVTVQGLGDPREPRPLRVQGEDAPHGRGLLLVDHAIHVAVAVALVEVAEHAPTGRGAGLGPPTERVVRPLPRAAVARSWRLAS
jgi:hypothetical protein